MLPSRPTKLAIIQDKKLNSDFYKLRITTITIHVNSQFCRAWSHLLLSRTPLIVTGSIAVLLPLAATAAETLFVTSLMCAPLFNPEHFR